jgi:hypothetical protein
MTLERFLLIAGRIISVLFAIVLIIHLVFTVTLTSVFSASATTPQAFADNLQEADFQQELGSAALAVVLNALPSELEIGNTAINTADLVNALLAVEWRDLATQLGSGDLVNALISDVLSGVVSQVGGEVQDTVSQQAALLSDRLSGRPAYQIAQLVVAAVQACTEDQIDRLLAAAESSNFTAIDFICNPTTSGDNLQGVMRDIIVVGLGNFAAALSERADEVLAGLNLGNIQIETPLGVLSLDWPEVVVTRGNFSVNVPLPQNFVDRVNEVVGGIQASISSARSQLNTQVEQSQADLEALATQIVTDAQASATAAAPTATLPPTDTPTPAPTAEATPEPPSQVSIAIHTALNDLTVQLVALANSINGFLWGALAFDAIIILIAVLFMLRRWTHMGLWAGIVLLISGVAVEIVNIVVAGALRNLAVTPYPNEVAEVAQLQTTLRTSLANAIYSGFDQPLLLQAIVLIVAGILLLVAAVYFMRRAGKKGTETVTDTPAKA